ncbi:hypothetical protein Q1695_006688 [Nippostrongylus brasiliensis]|nr:hypothetical protein Q1695_006688 [Nippostrongylus brasiliensis]
MFPAYATGTANEKEDGEIVDDNQKFSSFDEEKILEARARKEKRAKEAKMRERMEHQMAPRYIYSDDDEVEVHVPMAIPAHHVPFSEPRVDLPSSKKKKKKKSKASKKHKNKKKRRRHTTLSSSSSSSDSDEPSGSRRRNRGSSSSSSSSDDSSRERRKRKVVVPPSIEKEKWSFLGHGEERSREGSFIVYDRQYDHLLFGMDSIPKGHTTLFFPAPPHSTKDRSYRYYGGALRNLNEADVENRFRKKAPPQGCEADFIPLSHVKLKDFQFLYDIEKQNEENKAREELEAEVSLSTSPDMVPLEVRRRLITTRFGNDPKNLETLEEYLRINEEIFEAGRAQHFGADRRALVERQLSIVDKAIAHNARSVELRIKRLEFMKEIHPTSELLLEWEKLLNAFVNNCSLWEKYLDHIQYDMALYTRDILEKAFDRCFVKLGSLLNGSFKSHKADSGTDAFLLRMYVRRLTWWMECGYTNRAVASVQACIEYYERRPHDLVNAPEKQLMEAFAKFWRSGVPRIGDREAKGWAYYFCKREVEEEPHDPEILEREIQTQLIASLEERIASSANDAILDWSEMECELDNIESRPRRPLRENYARENDQLHAQSELDFRDIRIVPVYPAHCGLVLLRALGVQFPEQLDLNVFHPAGVTVPPAPTFCLLDEWDLMPSSTSMFRNPCRGAIDIALNIVYSMVKHTPCTEFVFVLLETKAYQTDLLYHDAPKSVRCAKFQEYLREVMKELEPLDFKMTREEFELAVVAYAVSVSRRWVQEGGEGFCPSNPDENETQQKKKKKKKEGRLFTRSRLIERLRNLVFNDVATPLHLLGPRRTQILLRMLISLIQAILVRKTNNIAGSSTDRESDVELVREAIAAFVLRKNCEKVTKTDALAALDAWKQLFRSLDRNKSLTCFESSRALCVALRIYFDYSKASHTTNQWIEECAVFLRNIEPFTTEDDKGVVIEAYLDVLEHHWRSSHTGKENLVDILKRGQEECPHKSSFIRRYIDLCAGRVQSLKVHRFIASRNVRADPTLDTIRSLSFLYLEKRKAETLQEAGVTSSTNVSAQITRREASRRMDPALWRLAMEQCFDERFFEETHVMASAQCGWSRHLHIDRTRRFATRQKCEEIICLMEERGAHVFNDLDYVDVLKEVATVPSQI